MIITLLNSQHNNRTDNNHNSLGSDRLSSVLFVLAWSYTVRIPRCIARYRGVYTPLQLAYTGLRTRSIIDIMYVGEQGRPVVLAAPLSLS